MKEFFRVVKFEIRMFIHKIYFKRMKKKADNMHVITGKRYHVIPIGGNKLAVVNNDYINHYNRTMCDMKNFKKLTIERLISIAYYSTSVKK
jgi:hypothetical protein